MAGNGGADTLADEERCKRTDGKRWRCRRPVVPGRTLCESHFLQGRLRQNKEPVPESLKLKREKGTIKIPKMEDPTDDVEIRSNNGLGVSSLPQKGGRKRKEVKSINDVHEKSTDEVAINPNGDSSGSNLPLKRGKRARKEEKPSVNVSEKLDGTVKKTNLKKKDNLNKGSLKKRVEKKKEKHIKVEDPVRDLEDGTSEIPQAAAPLTIKVNSEGPLKVKGRVPASNSVPRRPSRSKKIESSSTQAMQALPKTKPKAKASARKKCHWCRMSSYRLFVKCLTCKKNFFCEDCILERFHDKAAIKRECPICCGTCSCRACIRERLKDGNTEEVVVCNVDEEVVVCNVDEEVVVCNVDEEVVVCNVDEEVVVCNIDEEVVVCNVEKKFDESPQQQLLYLTDTLLPLLEQINQEKIIELDIESKIKGIEQSQLQIQIAVDSLKQQCCSFCKACIVDIHRKCENCSYILCVLCCREFREGHLHEGIRAFKYIRTVRRKSLCTILWNWKTSEDGTIRCPPKNLGGCGDAILDLKCFSPFDWTQDLEASAKAIICNYKFTKLSEVDSVCCPMCEKNGENGSETDGKVSMFKMYFSTNQDFLDQNLEHFVKHWVKGQPLVIRDVVKSQPELNWDPISMFSTYLERSASVKSKSCSDWCEVEIGRKQIFMGGKTHANVWHELLKFKVWLSSGFFQEHFPSHYSALIDALPLQEYMNPLTGFLNLALKLPQESQSFDLGPFVYISYGRPEELMQAESLTKLCYHAYDMVNILVHATERPISEKKLCEVKNLMNKYSSQDRNEFSKKIENHNKIDEMFGKAQQLGSEDNTNFKLTQIPNGEECVSSDDSHIEDSDDEDLCPNVIEDSSCHGKLLVGDTHGAIWDIFRREDVPKLVEYLKKYCNELDLSYGPPRKVVHPILDECFYLDAFHKRKLKEEYDIESWTIEQHIGEAVIVPAGCPYQVKKTKSSVNVVLEFFSPESALECIKLTDELRHLPVNHKAKCKMPEVKKMTIHSISAAIEQIRNASEEYLEGSKDTLESTSSSPRYI